MKTGKKNWRRGWESNSEGALIARKLLIFRDAPAAPTTGTARLGYSLGTDSPSPFASRLLALAPPLSLLSPLLLAQGRRAFTVPFHTVNGLILLDAKVNGDRASAQVQG
jgi:hypothetical protein